MKLKIFLLGLLIPIVTFGQLDSIQKLDEVVLSDVKLKQFTKNQFNSYLFLIIFNYIFNS